VAGFDHLPPGVVPFAVGRHAAAALVGISAGFFDKLVNGGRMPQPRDLDGRVLWDSDEVRAAWRALPKRGQTPRRNTFDEEGCA
jgi:predicted DNA-binding transcriptional regulator AlpA